MKLRFEHGPYNRIIVLQFLPIILFLFSSFSFSFFPVLAMQNNTLFFPMFYYTDILESTFTLIDSSIQLTLQKLHLMCGKLNHASCLFMPLCGVLPLNVGWH